MKSVSVSPLKSQIKIPSISATLKIFFTVQRIEECIDDWFGVADVTLEPVRYGFLSLVVPNL